MPATIQDVIRAVGDLERKLSRSAPAPRPLATLPGQSETRVTPADPTILEAARLQKLGRALGSTWYSWEGRELRATTPANPGDAPQPGQVLIHVRIHHPAGMVEVPGPDEWSPSKRSRVEAWDEDLYLRGVVLEGGAFAAAQQHDAARQARAAKRSDPAAQAERALRLERAKARQRWLAGYDVDAELLGFDR